MKKVKPPKLVTVAVFTTITIVFWIFFSVYNILTTEAEINVEPELLKPINPNINTQVLDQLPNRRFYEVSTSEESNVFDNIDTTDTTPEEANPEVPEATPTPEEEQEVTEETEEESTEAEEEEVEITPEPDSIDTNTP